MKGNKMNEWMNLGMRGEGILLNVSYCFRRPVPRAMKLTRGKYGTRCGAVSKYSSA